MINTNMREEVNYRFTEILLSKSSEVSYPSTEERKRNYRGNMEELREGYII